MNILSIDIGKKRTGFCLLLEGILLPQKSFNTEELQEKIDSYIHEYEIRKIIIGTPLSAAGDATDMAKWIKGVADGLRMPDYVDVQFFNERLTTKEAERFIREEFRGKKDKENIDSISAMMILKEYIDNEKE